MVETKLYNGDCLEIMKQIQDKSVDCIICDLPYGMTKCSWDTIIPFDKLWEQYKRICKENTPVILFGSEPFSSYLRISNIDWYKYDWIWVKTKATGFLNVKRRPLKQHEIISVFSKNKHTYNPQGLVKGVFLTGRNSNIVNKVYGGSKNHGVSEYGNYPKSVLYFANPSNTGHLHPTQKPVDLLEYLIKTYSNEGDVVLDNCMGSGSTGVACANTNRNFIGIELDENYFKIAEQRINEALNINKQKLF